MALRHRRGRRPGPGATEVTLSALAVPVLRLRPELLPQQPQRDAAPLHLFVNLAPIDRRARWTRFARDRKQTPFELGVVDLLGHGPCYADHARSAHVFSDHRLADARRFANLTQTHPSRVR